MTLKILIQFPFFAPQSQPHHHHHGQRPVTEIRFSRWNNANAEKFNRQERAQKLIEDELRFHKRFDSAHKIANNYNDATTTSGNDTFKSTGTPSTPSRSSIPGNSSKYSKNAKNPEQTHPAFNRIFRLRKLPNESEKAETGIKIGDNGVSYLIPEAPFEFQYSYTETPKAKPLKFREPAIAPFGPSTMPRPWTGCKPLPPSKKKIDFDSFKLPPPHKKGVKPVQAPGPFLPGSGPKYVMSREEILGEPLTKEEIDELVKSCLKSQRQLNMGRDGLTHNMLDNIHAHWKRRRVCKIKCKGVCTVDMDNVRQQLEDKTGGKIIYGKGGVLYLFRGRNYNYKTHPRFPLMLWKPITPVYPRLVKRVPEGLTLEEVSEMRKKGRELTPICKLGKNGLYCDLANNVREAFEACELVRINCQGMNPSDYRRIGAKLKDLVPCVLISFEREHILLWRGSNWKSSLPILEEEEVRKSKIDSATSITSPLEGQVISTSCLSSLSVKNASLDNLNTSPSLFGGQDVDYIRGSKNLSEDADENLLSGFDDMPTVTPHALATVRSVSESKSAPCSDAIADDSEPLTESCESKMPLNGSSLDADDGGMIDISEGSEAVQGSSAENLTDPLSVVPQTCNEMQYVSKNLSLSGLHETVSVNMPWMEGVFMLQKQAIEGGSAVVLDESSLDANIVYERAVALAKSAPRGPVFRHRPRKVAVQKCDAQETGDLDAKEVVMISNRSGSERKSSRNQRKKDFKEDNLHVVPPGNLRVDELAKLLA